MSEAAEATSGVRVYLSFDVEHDGDLCERLCEESRRGGSGFHVAWQSENGSMSERWQEEIRRRVRAADEVIVICGEHTSRSDKMNTELWIAREEEKPFLLLWGRRDRMCTMPVGVDRKSCMYSWTWEVLVRQVAQAIRDARPLDIPANCRRA